jgi:prevent-host-death family protein
MSMKALPIGEARKRLPELVRRVAEGHPAVAIGRKGRPEVTLVPAGAATLAVKRRPLQGLVQIVGSERDLERSQQQVRRSVHVSLERTARLVAGHRRKRGS